MLVAIWLKADGDPLAQSSWRSRINTPGNSQTGRLASAIRQVAGVQVISPERTLVDALERTGSSQNRSNSPSGRRSTGG